jgi:predicted DNA-binding transcriptional regulator AlpA
MYGLSRGGWLKLHREGKVPRPKRLGRRVLWDREELKDWWAAGAPDLASWESQGGREVSRG